MVVASWNIPFPSAVLGHLGDGGAVGHGDVGRFVEVTVWEAVASAERLMVKGRLTQQDIVNSFFSNFRLRSIHSTYSAVWFSRS